MIERLFKTDPVLVGGTGQKDLFTRTLGNSDPNPLMGKEEGDNETKDHQAAYYPDDPDSRVFGHLYPCILF